MHWLGHGVSEDALLFMWAPSPFYAQATGTNAMAPSDEWIPISAIRLNTLGYWDDEFKGWRRFEVPDSG